MNRSNIEDALAAVVEAGERVGFRVIVTVGGPLSRSEFESLAGNSDISLSHDYSEFLLTANGIKIEFNLRCVPEDFYPAFTFQIAGIPEALDLTSEWRRRIDKFVRDGQESSVLPYRNEIVDWSTDLF